MELQIINPIKDERWLNFISSHPDANIFHHPSWLSVLHGQYNYSVFAVCVFENNQITAGIPFCEISSVLNKKKWISLPFSDYCNPLYNSKEQLETLLEFLTQKQKEGEVGFIAILSNLTVDNEFNSASSAVLHVTKVEGTAENMLKAFHRTKRQGIKKAAKDGLCVKLENDSAAIEKFYALHLKTRKKKGVPIQPRSFFTQIYENFFVNDLGFVAVVYKGNLPIAAGLFLCFNNTLTYKYNASDPEYLKYRPNNLIIWETIKQSINKGIKFYDFGRTDFDNEGLKRFKKGWAAEETSLYYSYFPAVPENSLIGALKEKLVAPIIKSSPDIVCKVIGELAYKYFPVQ